MRLARALSLLFLGAALLVCLVGAAVTARFAPPRRHDRIAGVALGLPGDLTRIARRNLDCTRPAANSPVESCTITVEGKVLRVDVEHHSPPQWRFRDCKVSYGTRIGSCWPGTFGGSAYAMIGTDFGVAGETIRALRRENRLENLPEASWSRIITIMAGVLALGVALVATQVAGGWGSTRTAAAAVSGAGTFVLSWYVLTLFMLVMGVID